jgi:hypothetical protein
MKIVAALISLGGLLLLASCCFDPCVGVPTSAVTSFRFSADTLTGRGFRQQEVRSVYVVAYLDNNLTQPIDIFRLLPAKQPTLVLFEKRRLQLYFDGDSIQGRPAYYRIAVPAAQRHFDVQHIALTVATSTVCRTTACQTVTGVYFTLNKQPLTILGAYKGADQAITLQR